MKKQLSHKQRKLISSLSQKKYRNQHQLFIVEGIKSVTEFLASSYELYDIYVTDNNLFQEFNPTLVTQRDLQQLSQLKNANEVLAVFEIPIQELKLSSKQILALDNINDPGNLGTIIRICDWFDIKDILCSTDTVDCYNSKVVQASMGSLSRVNIHYVNLPEVLESINLPIITAEMNGDNVYKTELPNQFILVMGNEANGVSERIHELANLRLSIPQYGENPSTESLNVAVATSVLISEFKRQDLFEC